MVAARGSRGDVIEIHLSLYTGEGVAAEDKQLQLFPPSPTSRPHFLFPRRSLPPFLPPYQASTLYEHRKLDAQIRRGFSTVMWRAR